MEFDLFGEKLSEPEEAPKPRPPEAKPILRVWDPSLTRPQPFQVFRISKTEILIWHDLEAKMPRTPDPFLG